MSVLERRSLLLTMGAAALQWPARAAEPWEKDPSKWSDKEIEKVMTDSPWARSVSIQLGMGGGMPSGGRGGRGGRGGGGGGSMTDASMGSGSMGGGGGAGGGGGMGGGGGDMGPGAPVPSIRFLVQWRTATPVKAAIAYSKMGAEAATSPQAKAFIEKEEETYVVALHMPGMPPQRGGAPNGPGGPGGPGGAEAEQRVKDNTTLTWKGHENVHPVKVIMPNQNSAAMVFHFAKTHPIELEDKEVEFATKRGNMEIKKKFKLKDMVYQGKLCL